MDKETLEQMKSILEKAREKILEKALPKLPDILSTHDHSAGPTKVDTPARQAAVDHINKLRTSGLPGAKAESLRIYETYISGKPGSYTAGPEKDVKKMDTNHSDKVHERSTFFKNGQWKIEKISEVANTVQGQNEQVGTSAVTETPNVVQGGERKI